MRQRALAKVVFVATTALVHKGLVHSGDPPVLVFRGEQCSFF